MNATHRALVMDAPGAPLRWDVRPTPEPLPGEVLVQVRGSSLNYHDLVTLSGLIPGPWPRVPMTDGAGTPLRSTYFYTMYLFDHAFGFLNMGYACAMAWVLFLMISTLTLVANHFVRDRIVYGAN